LHLFFTYYNSYPNDPPKHKEKHKENRQSVDFSDSLGLETVNHEENDDDQQNLDPNVIGRHRNQLRDDLLEDGQVWPDPMEAVSFATQVGKAAVGLYEARIIDPVRNRYVHACIA
jgi:hypothetical protein